MKLFAQNQAKEAIRAAAEGELALHVWTGADRWPHAPQVFKATPLAGHLLGQSHLDLVRVAMDLGVHLPAIQNGGTRTQHIDLCGAPLRRAIRMCEGTAGLPQSPRHSAGEDRVGLETSPHRE